MLVMTGCAGSEPLRPAAEPTSPPTPSGDGASELPEDPEATRLMTLADPRVTEASGIARSTWHRGVLLTHNDRGSAPQIFAVDRTGTRATFRVDVAAVDWEDIAATPDGRIWIADTGNNQDPRSTVSVHVVEEPTSLADTTLRATTYRFRYPDAAADAEALLVHPETTRVYLVTKDQGGGTVYVAPSKLRADKVNPLRALVEAPPNVTGGDFAADGSALVLRSYGRAFFYRQFGEGPVGISLPKQPQGEGITFDEQGTHVLLASEGRNSSILQVAVPEEFRTDNASQP